MSAKNRPSGEPASRNREAARKRILSTKLPGALVSLAFVAIEVWFYASLIRSKLVATKFMVLIAAALILFGGLVYFLSRDTKKLIRFIVGCVIAVLVGGGLLYGGSVVNKVKDTIEDFIPETTTEPSHVQVGVFVLEEDSIQAIDELAALPIGIDRTFDRDDTDRALKQIETALGTSLQVVEYDGFMGAIFAMMSNEVRAVVMNPEHIVSALEIFRDMEGTPPSFRQLTVLHVENNTQEPATTVPDPTETLPVVTEEPTTAESTEEVETTPESEEETTEEETTPAPTPAPTTRPTTAPAIYSPDASRIFTMYIQGIDSRSGLVAKSRCDVNILAVVNMNSKQLLLINTPRDMYVPMPALGGARDKLTHNGWYGVWSVIETLKNLYGVQADYYFRCDFGGFQRVIDAMGGITVWCDRDFTSGTTTRTVEVLVPGTNEAGEEDPTAESQVITKTETVPLYSFHQGNNNLNGVMALEYARERHAFGGGDGIRGVHQMDIIKAVINKAVSGSVLSNIGGVLGSLSGAFETNMSYDMIASMARALQSGGWNITSYSTGGSGSSEWSPMARGNVYVLWPNYNQISYAQSMIRRIYNGEWVTP